MGKLMMPLQDLESIYSAISGIMYFLIEIYVNLSNLAVCLLISFVLCRSRCRNEEEEVQKRTKVRAFPRITKNVENVN